MLADLFTILMMWMVFYFDKRLVKGWWKQFTQPQSDYLKAKYSKNVKILDAMGGRSKVQCVIYKPQAATFQAAGLKRSAEFLSVFGDPMEVANVSGSEDQFLLQYN